MQRLLRSAIFIDACDMAYVICVVRLFCGLFDGVISVTEHTRVVTNGRVLSE